MTKIEIEYVRCPFSSTTTRFTRHCRFSATHRWKFGANLSITQHATFPFKMEKSNDGDKSEWGPFSVPNTTRPFYEVSHPLNQFRVVICHASISSPFHRKFQFHYEGGRIVITLHLLRQTQSEIIINLWRLMKSYRVISNGWNGWVGSDCCKWNGIMLRGSIFNVTSELNYLSEI